MSQLFCVACGAFVLATSAAHGIIVSHEYDALEKNISIDVMPLTLASGIAAIQEKTGITIVVDDASLKRLGVDKHRKLALQLRDVPAVDAISSLLFEASPNKLLAAYGGKKGGLVLREYSDRDTLDMVIIPLQRRPRAP